MTRPQQHQPATSTHASPFGKLLCDAGSDRLPLTLAAAASLVMLAWMARPLVTGQIPITGDLLHFQYPLRDFYSSALASGHRFEWMPGLYGGFYLVGEGQLGTYHPLHWLLYRWLPLDIAFNLEVIGSYPLILLGTWLFLRRWCDAASCLFGAMLFAFCSFNLAHGMHVNMIAVLAHVPWLLAATAAVCFAADWASRSLAVTCVALLTGSQLLLGHPQGVWFSVLIEGAYLLFLLTMLRPSIRLSVVASVICGNLLGLLIGAIQLLATWNALQDSLRQAYDQSFAFEYSLPPLQLLQLLHPYLLRQRVFAWGGELGDELIVYCGAVPLLLTVWWLGLYLQQRRKGLTTPTDQLGLCACGFGLLGLWLATGSYGLLYYLQTWLPVVGQFRAPVRYALFTQLSVAAVSALALMRLVQLIREGRRCTGNQLLAPWILTGLVVLSAAWLAWGISRFHAISAEALLAASLGPALFLGAAGLLTVAARGSRWALGGLVVLAAFDQALYGLGGSLVWQQAATRDDALQQVAREQQLPPVSSGRLVRGENDSVYPLLGYRTLDGYAGLVRTRALNYLTPNALRVASVDYVHDVFQQVAQIPGLEQVDGPWHKLPATLPRARLVTDSRISQRPDIDLQTLDIEHSALTTHELNLAGGEPGNVTILQDDPGDIHFSISTPGRQLLIVSESYDPGWEAGVDGQPAAVEQVNGDFLGCVVEPGKHELTLQFQPAHLALGRAISFFGLAVTLVAGLLAARQAVNLQKVPLHSAHVRV